MVFATVGFPRVYGMFLPFLFLHGHPLTLPVWKTKLALPLEHLT